MSKISQVSELTTLTTTVVPLADITFKSRIALRAAAFVTNPSVSFQEIQRQPTVLAAAATKAVANESNR